MKMQLFINILVSVSCPPSDFLTDVDFTVPIIDGEMFGIYWYPDINDTESLGLVILVRLTLSVFDLFINDCCILQFYFL